MLCPVSWLKGVSVSNNTRVVQTQNSERFVPCLARKCSGCMKFCVDDSYFLSCLGKVQFLFLPFFHKGATLWVLVSTEVLFLASSLVMLMGDIAIPSVVRTVLTPGPFPREWLQRNLCSFLSWPSLHEQDFSGSNFSFSFWPLHFILAIVHTKTNQKSLAKTCPFWIIASLSYVSHHVPTKLVSMSCLNQANSGGKELVCSCLVSDLSFSQSWVQNGCEAVSPHYPTYLQKAFFIVERMMYDLANILKISWECTPTGMNTVRSPHFWTRAEVVCPETLWNLTSMKRWLEVT